MDNLKWRFPSRIVAIVDLGLQSFGISVLVLIIYDIYFDSAAQKDPGDLDSQAPKAEISDVLWTIIVVACILVIAIFVLSIWANVMLLKATKEEIYRVDAAKKARIWLNVNKVFFFMSLLYIFRTTQYAALIFGLAIRASFIFIVYKFTGELEQGVGTPGFNNP